MIKLKNINKTYTSKGKQRVQALKDINLEFQNNGFVFILGKSGSGKSTLLNILGGIDSPTSGEMFVDNINFSNFKQEDLDNYRNEYVGFVFQEFNLLYDFDVSGNISLALHLSKESDIIDRITKALKAVGLNSDYLTRRIDELSGGEKQRIAIARAIVKDSRMTLADEPTGNLDSETGAGIWNILKDLSKSKLVIAVTHDRESAEKYGDRIIEIADGKIIADNGEQPESSFDQPTFIPKKKRLGYKVLFKMGTNNLLLRKVRAISVILLAIFTIFTLLLSQLSLTFSSEKACSRFIKENNIDYILLSQGDLRYFNEFRPVLMKPSTLNYIANNTAYIRDGIVEKKQDVLELGLNFIGDALELDDNSFYLTTYGLKKAYERTGSFVEIDGKEAKLIKEQHPIEFLIGEKVDIGSFHSMKYILAGVVDTSQCNQLVSDIFPEYFARENFGGRRIYDAEPNELDYPMTIMHFGEAKYSEVFKSISSPTLLSGKILTESGLQNDKDIVLADAEIILTYELYAELFSASPKWSYVSTDLKEVIRMPEHIGQSFELKFFHDETNELLVDAGTLKIVGISFSEEKEHDPNRIYVYDKYIFVTGKNTVRKINGTLRVSSILVAVVSIAKLDRFLVNL